MKHFLVISALMIVNNILAQSIDVNILRKESLAYFTSDIKPTSFNMDEEGNFYISHYHSITVPSGSTGYYFELTKFDSQGNFIWSRDLFTDNEGQFPHDFRGAHINNIAFDNEGGIYLAGNFGTDRDLDFPPFTLYGESSFSDVRTFIARLDTEDGSVTWLLQDNNFDNMSSATDIIFDNGELYVSFYQEQDQEIVSSNSSEIYQTDGKFGILKLSSSGEILDEINGTYFGSYGIASLWDPNPSGWSAGRQLALSPKLAINDNHDILIIGYFIKDLYYNNDTLVAKRNEFDETRPNCFIGRVNPDFTWNYIYSPFMYDHRGNSRSGLESEPIFAFDNNGNVYQSFFRLHDWPDPGFFVFEDGTIDTVTDACVFKHSPTGEIEIKQYLNNRIIFKSIHLTENGYDYFGTYEDYLNIFSYSSQQSYGEKDLCFVRMNNNQEVNSVYKLGSIIDEHAFMSIKKEDVYYLLGASDYKLKYNNEFIMDETETAFIIKLDLSDVNSIDDVLNNKSCYQISPNPAYNILNVVTDISEYSISIFDGAGKSLMKKSGLVKTEAINISTINRGIYFVMFESQECNSVIQKLVISR